MAAYIFFSLVLPLRIRLRWKALLALLLLFCGGKYAVYSYWGGSFFNPDLPFFVNASCEALYNGLIMLFAIAVLKDALWLVLRFTGARIPFASGARNALFFATALGVGAWGVVQAMKVPEVRRVEIAVPGLPEALDGYSILQLTDLHIGALLKKEWLEAVVDRANAAAPDAIAITGDFVDGTVASRGESLRPLARLRAREGVYGIPGNHEYYYGEPEWMEFLRGLGISMLENGHRALPSGLVIGGVTDSAARAFGLPMPNVAKAFEGAPEGIRILLSHRPASRGIPAKGVALQLSGHTHGGHITFMRPLVAHFNAGYVGGLYHPQSGGALYVSNGTGLWNGFACRILVPSEITLIILRRGGSAARP